MAIEKLSAAEQLAFNNTFIDNCVDGTAMSMKEATVSVNKLTRNILREGAFTDAIITPQDVDNSDLDKTQDPEYHVIYTDREPDTAPAKAVPLGITPDGYEFKGTRYPTFFYRLLTPTYRKDITRLRGYEYDIRALMFELSTKVLANVLDTRFLDLCTDSIGSLNTANPLNGRGLPQNISITGGINRDSLLESFKMMNRLDVPFGPSNPDGTEAKGTILCNLNTAMDLLKQGRNQVGGDYSETMWKEGKSPDNFHGIRVVKTKKYDLVPDGVMWYFSDENFLGKYFRLQPLTAFMKTEGMFLEWFQYMELGISIGNVRGVGRVQF